jgi:pyrroline-5-carboxylate reductase
VLEGNTDVASEADLVVLAVKPNVLDQVAPDLSPAGTPVLSILAGTTLETLREALPGIELVRVMPNLGAQLRQAVLCVTFPDDTPEERRREIKELLGLIGEVIELDEGLIDAATAIMGCSPGYLALMAEVLVEAGVNERLTEDQTRRMVAKAMSATGGLLEVREPGELKRAVASPGGMTEAGLNALEEHDLREALKAAVEASLEVARR